MLVKKLLNRTLLSLIGLMVATASQAGDCVLSGVNNTDRILTNNDTAAITQAAKDNADITGCKVSGIPIWRVYFISIQTLSIKTSVVGMCRTSQI